ncbi:MAG: hypothetical protein ABI702_14815, partial [Burkholderiales bacterium]
TGNAVLASTGVGEISGLEIRLSVHTGVLALLLVSLTCPRQASLVCALNATDLARPTQTDFKQANRLISGAWALAFATLIARDILIMDIPKVPLIVDSGVPLAAIALAGAATARFRSRSTRERVRAI